MPDKIDEIISERGVIYGEARIQFGVAQAIKHDFRNTPNWDRLSNVEKEALDMIATKLSRILVGKHNEQDHWDDIAGYAKVVSARL